MSIEYFLYLKNKYNIISTYLKEINNIYEDLIDITKEEETNEEIQYKKKIIHLMEELKNKNKKMIDNNNIFLKSEHNCNFSKCNYNRNS